MGIRVLNGVHFLEVLAYLIPLCNEDTDPVTPSSVISGCDTKTSHSFIHPSLKHVSYMEFFSFLINLGSLKRIPELN
ncbi:hypothetical protein Hanom_Chr00s000001g01593761 [Helianthus anomalus]